LPDETARLFRGKIPSCREAVTGRARTETFSRDEE